MFFDDRLATVLRQRASSDVGRRTQFRQLLDILGAERGNPSVTGSDPDLISAAWLRLNALAGHIPSEDRAAMIREAGWRFRNPALAAHLADFEPDVASAALNRAQLTEEDWRDLIPHLPVRARGFLRLRRDLPLDTEVLLDQLGVQDRGLPAPLHDRSPAATIGQNTAPVPPAQPPERDTASPKLDRGARKSQKTKQSAAQKPPKQERPLFSTVFDPASEGRSEISALVERIAQFKRSREGVHDSDASDNERMPRLPLGENLSERDRQINAFGFAADAAGRIEWAQPEVAPMVIGARMCAPSRLGAAASKAPLERAFSRRQPIVWGETKLDGAPAIVGDWIVDAQPRFTDDGNFAGYVGRFRRPAKADPDTPSASEREADRIRQLLHELRTPVTAVQGYAEVIQQQLFGTAPHGYRALAAAIAADAARVLSGFEELDRLAKLETGATGIEGGESDLAELATNTVRQLAQVLGPRMAGIEIDSETDDRLSAPVIVALDSSETEALLWRLLATLGGGCSAGEMLKAQISTAETNARLTCELPTQLRTEQDIFTAEVRPVGTTINAGLFGAGFALRLARAEARAAGGNLLRDNEHVTLTLPLLQEESEDQPCESLGDT